MGALKRATSVEIAQRAEDPLWWEDVRARLTDGGTLKELCEEHYWSYGAVWGWINAEGGRRKEYDVALEGKAERAHDECIPIADESGEVKHRLDERRKSMTVWNRKRFRDEAKAGVGGVPVLNIVIVGEGGVALPAERVIEVLPEPQPAEPEYERI